MENASKALIIAGAILLSILLIGMGVFIYNQATSTMKNINMNEQEIMAFNSKFERYVGENITGVNAKTLCDLVSNNNVTNSNGRITTSNDSKIVYIKIIASNGSTVDNACEVDLIKTVKSYIGNGEKGKVSLEYNNAGLVKKVILDYSNK